jgi:hypothetical protein
MKAEKEKSHPKQRDRKSPKDQGICLDERAQEQPTDKERAQEVTRSRDKGD